MKFLWLNWRDIKHPWHGGAEVHLHEIARRLNKRGHDVTVVSSWCPQLAKREWIDGYKVIRVGNHENYPIALWTLLRGKGRDYDVVIEDINKVPLFTPFFLKHPTKMLAIVHHLNQEIFFEEISFGKALIAYFLESLMPYLYTKVFKIPVITVSESTKLDLVKLKADPKMITTIHNGVDHNKYRPLTNDIFEQKSLNSTIFYINRLKKYKQPDHVLMAFKYVAREIQNVKLVMAGNGELLPKLKQLAKKLEIEDKVEFKGYISDEEKIRLMQKSLVHIQTSQKEGWGLSVIEAAACGTPTIAYNTSGLKDSIINEVTGFLTPSKPTFLANKIITLLKDVNIARAMSENSYEYAKTFNWEKTVSELLSFIENRKWFR